MVASTFYLVMGFAVAILGLVIFATGVYLGWHLRRRLEKRARYYFDRGLTASRDTEKLVETGTPANPLRGAVLVDAQTEQAHAQAHAHLLHNRHAA